MLIAGRLIGPGAPLFLIAGPCVLESEALALRVADVLARAAARHDMLIIFKSSFDKANRTSRASFRGPGMVAGLEILAKVRRETGLPVLTDVHEPGQVAAIAQVVDVIQTPALLARQTDLIAAVGASGRTANIKKGQFMAPGDMRHVVDKARAAATAAGHDADCVMVTERGTSFGYNNLVVDMRAMPILAETGAPVVFDATHSAQTPGGLGDVSGGDRRVVPTLALAAVAAGAHGIFMETHPDPDRAQSDGPNSIALDDLPGMLERLLRVHRAVHI